jgi:hypothetical protein
MRLLSHSADFRRILRLFTAVSLLAASVCHGEEQFPNELNSPIDEPQVVLPESPHKVPVRAASGAVQQSTDPLVKLVYETREVQRQRLLSSTDHTPWQMMHGLLGLRQDFLINHNGETINGLEWMQTGPMFENEPWFEKTQFGGRAHPYNKPYAFEGHINQSLAILAMCNVPLDTQFGTPNGPVTMREMLKNAQMTVNEKEEVTWTLWALCTYLPSDAEWVNAKGERWSIERLVQVETGKKVGGPTSPCGGTHGLFALARARNVYLRTGKPLRGVWLDAEQKIQKYIETARYNQNSNGTLSSAFFKGKEYKQDFDKRMASSGHVLEFLMMALPQERLKEKWVRRAIEATANDLMANRKAYVSCSPLYHATDALSIYLDRVAPTAPPVAQQPGNTKAISNSKNSTESTPAATAHPPAMEKTTPPAAETGEKDATTSPEKPDSDSPLMKIPLPDPSDPAAAPTSPADATPPTPEPAVPTLPTVEPVVPGAPSAPGVTPEPSPAPAAGQGSPGTAPAPAAEVPITGAGSEPSVSVRTAELPSVAVVDNMLKAAPVESTVSPSTLVFTPSLAAAVVFGASAVSRTIVLAPARGGQVHVGAAVSGKEVQIKAGLSEGTAAMSQPQPLSKGPTIFFTPANAALADKADSKPPGQVAATAATPVSSQLLEPEPAQSGNEQTPGSVPKEPTRERHWRATPLDRRRTIVVDEPLDV